MHAPSYRRLQQYALAISIASIIYNGAEGGVSIGLGADADSRSLIFFGVQSGIEVISSILVVWRFRHIAKPGEERGRKLDARELRVEKIASTCIAWLLISLGLATEGTAIYGLVRHAEPSSSTQSLAVSASALVLMIIIWLPKRYLARALNSSAMQAEAQCSLSCIQITIVLFVGALVFKLWRGGWWVDSATSIVLGLSFAWEGIKLLKWVRDPDFDGGCCAHCRTDEEAQVGLEERYRDLCECCSEKEECRNSDECKCSSDGMQENSKACCVPQSPQGGQCCTHAYIPGPKPAAGDKQDSCCGSKDADCGQVAKKKEQSNSNPPCAGGCCAAKDVDGQVAKKKEQPNSNPPCTGGCCATKDVDDAREQACGSTHGKASGQSRVAQTSYCSTKPQGENKGAGSCCDNCHEDSDLELEQPPIPSTSAQNLEESDKNSTCTCCD